jgi:SAM-dependent MidA family methyltransferase
MISAKMNPLEQKIIEKIQNEGPITFEKFMEMALYYPELGYYSSPDTTIGRKGDFYTSPHLHPIFGAMIGKQLMEMWNVMGRPADFHAVEIGAGVGYLCKDIFDYLCKPSSDSSLLRDKSDFLSSLEYIIVEPYEHFQERQRGLLDYLFKGERGTKSNNFISWVKSLNELDNVVGCIFSNELLDAFPVHLIEMENELKEIYINFNEKEFVEEKNNVNLGEIANYIKQFDIDLQTHYRTEINLKIRSWLEDTDTALSNGFILTVDYGYSAKEYYSEERTKGTLLCYHKHLFNENPYQNIGEQDITAHVNFSSLKKWGEKSGLKTIGYCPQGTFLVAAGIDEVITELYSDSPDYLSETSKIKGLIMPQGMGESHSVMIQYKGEGLPELRGFSMRNQAGGL